jgi:hypothetical protein
MSIPEDLRDVLEICLAEEATPDNLAIYLPRVRAIVNRLLQGLRSKQSMYRRSERHPSRQHSGTFSHSRTNLPTLEIEKEPPAVTIKEPSPDRNGTNGVDASPPQTSIEPSDVPAVASSLAALKKSEALERRASKRLMTDLFSKIAGGAQNNRPSMAASPTLTPGDLAVETETEVGEPNRKHDGSAKRMLRAPSRPSVEVAPPVPPLPQSVNDAARPNYDTIFKKIMPPSARTPTHLSKLSEVEPEESPEPEVQRELYPCYRAKDDLLTLFDRTL